MVKTNIPSIYINEFTSIVEMQFNEKNYRPIFGLGKGGIGKTEAIHDLAVEKLKIGYIDVRLLLYSEVDLKGIPYPDEKHIYTIWLQNDILPRKGRDPEQGILVFDEITSCAKSVRTAAYQLLNERRLGEYELPEGWMIVCLGNGEEDGGDYQGMEGNFANRCSVFNIIPDVEAWKDWAYTHGVNSLVTSYISFRNNDLHSYNPESETELLFSSPRSWKAVSDILNIYGFDSSNKILMRRINANVGTRVGQSFTAFCNYSNQTLDASAIVKDGIMVDTSRISQEVIFITIETVNKMISDRLVSELENSNCITQETLKWLANGIKWFTGLNVEYATMAIKDLIKHDNNGIRRAFLCAEFRSACPEFFDFANKNSCIFA